MKKILKLIVLDVDGTLTDGGIYYDEYGNEMKKFCTKDAAGIFAAQKAGIKIMILTGRECKATTRRMTELKVDYLFQNIKNKTDFLLSFMKEQGLSKSDLGYIGDDLNDFSSIKLAEWAACPADACQEIIDIVNYVSKIKGGYGAVRDAIEHYLRKNELWDCAINEVYGIGV